MCNDRAADHALSLYGCIQIIEIISTAVAFCCSLLDSHWLTESGGGFVTMTLLISLVSVLVFFLFNSCCDNTGLHKMQIAEWIGYIITFALLIISVPVSIYGASKQYFESNGDGRTILIENSHIHGTIVFLILSLILFGYHFIYLTICRIRGQPLGRKTNKDGDAQTQNQNSNQN